MSDGQDLPAMKETQVQSLGREDALEKEMATHSRILTWEIPWTEEPGGVQTVGQKEHVAEHMNQRPTLHFTPGLSILYFQKCQAGKNG